MLIWNVSELNPNNLIHTQNNQNNELTAILCLFTSQIKRNPAHVLKKTFYE